MKIESTKTYKVEKYTPATGWTNCGTLGGDDVKSIVKTFKADPFLSDEDMALYTRKNTMIMYEVRKA